MKWFLELLSVINIIESSHNFRFVFIYNKAAKNLKTIRACTQTADLIL
jgi:hypothetical protein